MAITGGDPNSNDPREAVVRRDFGADAVLLKPFEKEELLAAVTQLLQAPRVSAAVPDVR